MKIIKKLLYSLVLIILFFLQSCEKENKNSWKRPKADRIKTDQYIDMGDSLAKKWDYDSAYYYYYKAKLSAESKKDTSRTILSLLNLATIHYHQADYGGAETVTVEIIPLLKAKKEHPYNYDLNLTLGNIYKTTLDYKNALNYYNKAIQVKKTTPLEKAGVANNIALVYLKIKEYKKAAIILEPLITQKEVLNSPTDYSRMLANLGYCYSKIGNPKALNYLNKSLQISLKSNDAVQTCSFAYLSEFYQKKNLKLAHNYALSAYNACTKLNHPDDRLEVLRFLIENNTGNKSKEYALIYLNLNDSIQKVRQKAKNQFAKIKYDFKKEKEENEILKTQRALEQEQQKNKNLFFYFIISLGLITTLFIYYYLITKNKKEKIKVSYNTEVRIAKKLHDELANDVYHTMAFAETQDLSTHSNKEKLLSNLDTIYTRTRNISKENSAINTDALFLPNLKEMMLGFSTDTVNILTNGMETIQWEKIETFKKITVYRVLQELLVNMKKHSNCSVVILSFKENENQLEINYTDNGIGVTEEQLMSKNGLKNAENRIIAIKGSITFDTTSDTGFKVNISFPI